MDRVKTNFASDQEVRWCPGCGDFAILKQTQKVLSDSGLRPEEVVFISGIGCSSRFPYYMNTYGFHTIHGRAPAIATGLKVTRPELSIWIVTGDGDALSIGGNHLIHLARRNVDTNLLLFNNQIYGLTKGQYSPTSELSKVTRSSPQGSPDTPFNPLTLMAGAGASFIARSIDREARHLQNVLVEANAHSGMSFVEILQNCNIFNDGAFKDFTEKKSQKDNVLFLEEGQPLCFGENGSKGIILDGLSPKMVDLDGDLSKDDLWVHDSGDRTKAYLLSQFGAMTGDFQDFPLSVGVIFKENRPCYEDHLKQSVEKVASMDEINDLLKGPNSWNV